MHFTVRHPSSEDHAMDMETLHFMEETIPMTSYERNSLRCWVYNGNCPDDNPWHYTDDDGYLMNYLDAYRYHHGYAVKVSYSIIEA
jgi:hypothetical protein